METGKLPPDFEFFTILKLGGAMTEHDFKNLQMGNCVVALYNDDLEYIVCCLDHSEGRVLACHFSSKKDGSPYNLKGFHLTDYIIIDNGNYAYWEVKKN